MRYEEACFGGSVFSFQILWSLRRKDCEFKVNLSYRNTLEYYKEKDIWSVN